MAKKPPVAIPAAPPAAPASDGLVSYHNPGGKVTRLMAGPAAPDGTVDLRDPETGEVLVSGCPASATPKEGHYTPA